ncbi:MAG: ABC transporter ATP-binding protein [Bacilli bacterium]
MAMKKTGNKKNQSILILLKGHFWGVFAILLLVIFHRVSYSFVPLFTQYVLKYLQNSGAVTGVNLPSFLLAFFNSGKDVFQVFLFVAISLLGYQLFRFATMVIEKTLQGHVQERIALELRVKLFDHVQSLSYHYHNNSDTGDLIQRVTSDVETTTGFVIVRLMEAIGLVFTIISGAYQMYFLSPLLMYISLSTIPLYGLSSFFYFRKVRKLYEDIETKEAEILTVVQENVHNTKIVKAFANEKYETEKLEVKNRAHKEASIKTNKIVGIYWGTMDFFALSQYLVITLVSINLARTQVMDAGDAAAALMLVGLLIWPIRGLGRLINDFSIANVAHQRIQSILKEESEFSVNGNLKPVINGNIEFKNVYFKFPGSSEYALENLNFSIKKGETVAFVGRTGSGKTTIINLLMRMYEYEGSILLDGVELREIEKHHLRKSLGTVLQNPFLYSRTIRENINITSQSAQMDQIQNASEIATIANDIRAFDKGYDTMVGERGTTLSGGQKQRVAIARVLISDKPILIFDDALSAVDNRTDVMIRQALNKKQHKSTNIIITHRITTAKEADKIIVVNQKTIEAIGVHETLAKAGELYQVLWDIQGDLEAEFLALIAKESV